MAAELHGSLTDFGIFGGILPLLLYSMMTFGTFSPCGSTSTNGTPSNVFGFQSLKTSRSPGASSL